MKLADAIQRINQALNFPSLAYSDMSHFLDQAIAELNTTLRIDLPLVSKMIEQSKIAYLESPDAIVLSAVPNTIIETGTTEAPGITAYWYNTDDGNFYVVGSDTPHSTLYGIYMPNFGERRVFQTAVYSNNMVLWIELDTKGLPSVELSNWLPDEWVILFLIPYVCSKCSARDGGDSTLYVEEYTQGFQQLQTSYNIPNEVILSDVASFPAYESDMKTLLNTGAVANQKLRTRAIYPYMKINTVEQAVFGSMYDNGGWGV